MLLKRYRCGSQEKSLLEIFDITLFAIAKIPVLLFFCEIFTVITKFSGYFSFLRIFFTKPQKIP